MTRGHVSQFAAALVLVTIVAFSAPAHSQVAGATVSGTVSDPSGAAIVGATVSVQNTATGDTRDFTTDAAGFYAIPNLAPGTYKVTSTAKGFSTSVRTGLVLGVGAQQQLNFSMKLGEAAQSVEVTAEASAVQLSTSTLGGEVEARTVRELPLNGRDWTQLATLQPGVAKIESQMSYDTSARGNRGFGNEYTISGGRSSFNNYRIDGISVVDYANAAPGNVIGVVLGVDAIEEFSVLTGGFSAEYGRASGGVVNATSKSGTNALHGNVYEFLRNSALDANDYFTNSAKQKKPEFRRNQFGGSVGGPIIKDHTFFFFDYEGLRQAKGIPTVATVPSPNARLGIVSGGVAAGQSAGTACTTKGNTPGHWLSPLASVCVSDYATALLPLWPAANGTITGDKAQFINAAMQVVPENFYTGRIDHKLGKNDQLFGTYLHDGTTYTQPDALNDTVTFSKTVRQTVAIEETHTFGSAFVNAARIGFNRDFVVNQATPSAGSTCGGCGASTALGTMPGQTAPRLSVGGGITDMFGGTNSGSHYLHTWNSYQFYDDAFLTHGRHSLKFGGGVERMQYNFEAFQNPGGRWKGFGGVANFLQGVAKSYEAGLPQAISEREMRQTMFSGYLQDDWRFRPNLTLNLGIRYEMATTLHDALGKLASLSDISSANVICGTPFNATTAFGVPAQAGTSCSGTGAYYNNPTKRNFEPRVGFAWDPFSNGKSSVRGGFGIYDILPLPGYFLLQQNQAAPFMIFKSTKAVNGGFTAGGGQGLLLNPAALAPLAASTIQTNPSRSYMMQWNMSLQRQLVSDLTLTVGYIGSRGIHLLQRGDDGNMTQPTFVPGVGLEFPCGPAGSGAGCSVGSNLAGNNAQVNQSMGVIRYIYWNTQSDYNGLNANLQKQFSRGFQMQLAYTWSKSLDDNSQTVAGDTFSNAINSPWWFLPSRFKGPSDFDVHQNISINGLWDLPSPKSLGKVGNSVLGGWEMGNIFSINTGTPTTPIIDGDPMGLNNNGADQFGLPNLVRGCDPVNHNWKSNGLNYLNLNCFTLPTAPTSSLASMPYPCATFSGAAAPAPSGQTYCSNLVGNVGRNSIYGPHFFSWDFSVIKNFKFTERFGAQFRAEFFDLTNHPNFVAPQPGSGDDHAAVFNTDGSTGTPGTISRYANAQQPSREIQFGLKLTF